MTDINQPVNGTKGTEFNLSDKIIKHLPELKGMLLLTDVKEFIKIGDELVSNARMYADMDETEFWETSTITYKNAQLRANVLEEFWEQMRKHAGDKLI
jgi:hypothetical protein